MLAVLDTVGPSLKLRTQVAAHGKITDGVLEGDLYVRGGGDPALEYPRWWKLVQDTYVGGVQRITGDLIIDNSLLEPMSIPGWSGGDEAFRGSLYEAPVSALNINYNSLGVLISPGAEAGQPVDARLEIPSPAATIDNQATTTRRGRTKIQVDRQQRGDQTELVITGTMPRAASTKWIYRSLADPVDYAGQSFRHIYTSSGGTIEGELRTGKTPSGTTTVAATLSPSTGTLLSEMIKHSNNQMAEQLAAVSAMETYGRSDRVAVTRLLTDTMQGHGIDLQGAVLLNASGLSRKGRLSARQLTQITHSLYSHPDWSYEAMSALAIIGRDGTVRNRLKGTPVADQVRVKTGSLSGVAAIAGVAESQTGQTLIFALLLNELDNERAAFPLWEDLAGTLVQTCALSTP
jgi:D-alanyl-D-alanine carboxypeptidase/D-alanyl-D-alanine-endopeptidase (penicillin-binding protein 4)